MPELLYDAPWYGLLELSQKMSNNMYTQNHGFAPTGPPGLPRYPGRLKVRGVANPACTLVVLNLLPVRLGIDDVSHARGALDVLLCLTLGASVSLHSPAPKLTGLLKPVPPSSKDK